jgi:hypothetical protein
MGGLTMQEQIARRNQMRNRTNMMLGKVAGSGAAGADYYQRMRSEVLPEVAAEETRLAAEEEAAKRGGAQAVMGTLGPTLTRGDPLAEAYAAALAEMQAPYGMVTPTYRFTGNPATSYMGI